MDEFERLMRTVAEGRDDCGERGEPLSFWAGLAAGFLLGTMFVVCAYLALTNAWAGQL